MDSKIIAILAVVVIVGAGAGAAFVLTKDKGSSSSSTYANNVDELARVYGNANNDSYLDSKDIDTINKIIGDTSIDWKKEYPFADANHDGNVNTDDVTYVQNFIDHKAQLMYYVTNTGDVDYVHFPISGDIGCNYDYGYMVAQIFGIWDQVKAGTTRWTVQKNADDSWKVTETRYPGVHSFINLGDASDKEVLAENILNNNLRVYFGQPDTGVETFLRAAETSTGKVCDVINLKFAQMNKFGTPVSTVMSCACMFDKQAEAKEYLDMFNNTLKIIKDRTAGLADKTFIQPYNPSDSGPDVHVDCLGISSANGYNSMGDYWTISLLPMVDGLGAQTTGNYITVEKEMIIAANPDVMIISLWGNITDQTTPAAAQTTFETAAAYMSAVPAYPKNTYGICFETIGTPLGVSGLMLLASYIWGEEVFTEAEGWDMLQQWYDKFTKFEGDVKQAGGIQVFKMSS